MIAEPKMLYRMQIRGLLAIRVILVEAEKSAFSVIESGSAIRIRTRGKHR